MRYLRSKKRATISMITLISIIGVALGVAALLAVLAITTGFEKSFRDKVLGVNAHVLVLKYGREFKDYPDVLESVGKMPNVAGVAPFTINEMMLTRDDHRAVVLVKGVTPEGVNTVLDLPQQMVAGDLQGLRREGAEPTREDVVVPEEDWEWLRALKNQDRDNEVETDVAERTTAWEDEVAEAKPRKAPRRRPEAVSPADAETLLDALAGDSLALPDDPDWEASLSEGGAQEPIDSLSGIVIGKTLAADLAVEVGDRVRLISSLAALGMNFAADGTAATKSREFRVIGVFEAGFQEYDSGLVYIDLYEAQRLFDEGDDVTGVELRVEDLDGSAALARDIEQDLGGAFHTLDWSELNRNLFTALEVQKIALTLVIATIIFVAAFNVIAMLIMVVLEKKREIAILKAMGASDQTVLGIFMVQGVVIGVVGTLLGVLFGGGLILYLDKIQFPLDPKVYLIDHLPVVLNPTVFLVTIGIALLICTLSTIAPSWWAARMLPVDGLRYE